VTATAARATRTVPPHAVARVWGRKTPNRTHQKAIDAVAGVDSARTMLRLARLRVSTVGAVARVPRRPWDRWRASLVAARRGLDRWRWRLVGAVRPAACPMYGRPRPRPLPSVHSRRWLWRRGFPGLTLHSQSRNHRHQRTLWRQLGTTSVSHHPPVLVVLRRSPAGCTGLTQRPVHQATESCCRRRPDAVMVARRHRSGPAPAAPLPLHQGPSHRHLRSTLHLPHTHHLGPRRHWLLQQLL